MCPQCTRSAKFVPKFGGGLESRGELGDEEFVLIGLLLQVWYSELEPGLTGSDVYGKTYRSTLNLDFYGEFFEGYIRTDAISALSELPHASYNSFHEHSIDYDTGPEGYAYFQHDGHKQFYVDGRLVQGDKPLHKDGTPNGKMKGRKIPEEPSYLILNIDMSTRWGWESCEPWWGCDCCTDCSNLQCTTCWVNGENKKVRIRVRVTDGGMWECLFQTCGGTSTDGTGVFVDHQWPLFGWWCSC